jgi:hypothetical protein
MTLQYNLQAPYFVEQEFLPALAGSGTSRNVLRIIFHIQGLPSDSKRLTSPVMDAVYTSVGLEAPSDYRFQFQGELLFVIKWIMNATEMENQSGEGGEAEWHPVNPVER